MIEVIIALLILLMIIASVIAIESRVMLHSVISLGAVGFLLSIVFLFLACPDLAITQMAVEVVTLVLLLNACRSCGSEPDDTPRFSMNRVVVVSMLVVVAIFSTGMLAELPAFGEPVMDRFADSPSATYLQDGLSETGSANIVTAVLLDFRAYDTLIEATVLFCAVLGALTVLRQQNAAKSNDAATIKADEETRP